ncbi:acetyl-coenzyme A synthetase N-terminal domain-containing protein [Methylomonas koyamae]|uniref:acetyl-coenzyme A synthetase N-terminal domain-containing protein n=1 Tax=Methylomonas koyamae TaxID=702114 RepID=UPI002110CC16
MPAKIAASAHIDAAAYQRLYRQSVEQPEVFWAEQAELFLDWQEPCTKYCNTTTPKAKFNGLSAAN